MITVIGSGLGGLSAAIRLASSGFEVNIYEQGSSPGGKAGSLVSSGFRFDTGPSLLTMPFVIDDLFLFAGEKSGDYLSINKLQNLCRYFYNDGTVINAFTEREKFAAEIENKTNEKKENLFRFLDYCKNIYDLTSDIFLFNNLYSISTYTNAKALKSLFGSAKIDPFRTLHKAVSGFFNDNKIIQLFSRYATYNGSNPYSCPATLNIIPHVEYNIGGYYINGGMHMLTEALHKLAVKKGVKFYFNSHVSRIVKENKRIQGIELNGSIVYCDAVISNIDVFNTYNRLLGDTKSKSAKKYSRLEPSSSALVFYWGVNIHSEKLDIHNILFSQDYKKEFRELFEEKIYPHDPTVYIYISSKFVNSDAPSGAENWFVMINAPYANNNLKISGYESVKKIIIDKIRSMTGYDISNKIISEKVMTPFDIEEQTGSFKGSIYGISSNNRKAAFLRQANKSREYRGLFFCGGSAHPGGGIPLVILSGKLCSEMLIKSIKQ